MIDRKTLRDFMQEAVREVLFDSPVLTREELCKMFGVKRQHQLSLDERIEFMRDFKRICFSHVVFTTKSNNYGDEYHVIYFKDDPVRTEEWDAFMNEIYSPEARS